jgi:hypothetical protein
MTQGSITMAENQGYKVRLLFIFIILLSFITGNHARADNLSSHLLINPAKAADPQSIPVLKIFDSEDKLRWQLPVRLWSAPRLELGGFRYPCGVPHDRPFALTGKLVYVGYGLTREHWDDYAGQRIDGNLAVIFTGLPQLADPIDREQPKESEAWNELIQEKVDNAKAHGATAVILEQSPLIPSPAGLLLNDWPGKLADWPIAAPTIWSGPSVEIPIPTFSMGERTLETVVALSTDLFQTGITTGDLSLCFLLQEAESQKQGLGPIPLGLRINLDWPGGQLRKQAGKYCDIWYQPQITIGDKEALSRQCDNAVDNLQSLLAVSSDDKITILLFQDWRSKQFAIQHLGQGVAAGNRMAMICQEGNGPSNDTLIHELCHLVAGKLGHPPACFDEGLATLMGSTLGDLTRVNSKRLLGEDRTTAVNLREGKLWALKDLLKLEEIGSEKSQSLITYPESASFCAYLIRKIGFDGFHKLYSSLQQGDTERNSQLIATALGKCLVEIENDWHENISRPR